MGRLVWTSNTPFPMEDWADLDIVKIAAGTEGILALTREGEAFHKASRRSCSIREDYWYNLKDIALSKACEGMAIGLTRDGTCMINKAPLRQRIRDDGRRLTDFDSIVHTVESWENIVQVACADAFFGLDAEGKVHHASFCRGSDDYFETRYWQDIVRIVPGATRHAIFGITRDGRVLCAGHNLLQGPMGDIRQRLAAFHDVVDICACGAECSRIFLVLRDGSLHSLTEGKIGSDCATGGQVLEGHFYAALSRDVHGRLTAHDPCFCGTLDEAAGWRNVTAMALGEADFGAPFALGLTD